MSLISPYLLLILLKGLHWSTKTPWLNELRTRPNCKLSYKRRGLKVKQWNKHPVQVATKRGKGATLTPGQINISSETVQDPEKTTKMKKTTMQEDVAIRNSYVPRLCRRMPPHPTLVSPVKINVCLLSTCMRAVFMKARRGRPIPWRWSSRQLWSTWSGTENWSPEARSSGGAVPTHISSASPSLFPGWYCEHLLHTGAPCLPLLFSIPRRGPRWIRYKFT